jgi:hypothetical protein
MAIVINSNPGTYYPANEDLLFTVFEATKAIDPVTYPDYKYICDIYINSVAVASLVSYPNPTNYRGIFNIGPVVRAYIAAAFNPSSGLRPQEFGSGEFYIDVQCKFGEDYGGTTYTNVTTDSSRTYYGHYNNRLIGVLTNLSAKVDKAATNRPVVNFIELTGEESYIPYLPSTTGSITVEVKSYNYSNALVATNSTTFNPSTANSLQQFNASPTAINSVWAGMITDYIKYYTYKINNDLFQFNLDCNAIFTTYVLHFLNQYGGFESFAFRFVSRKNIDLTRSGFQKLPYSMDASGNISYKSSNGVYNQQEANFATTWKEKLQLTSGMLTDDQYTWLGDLVISPVVYLASGAYFIPVTITANTYEYRKFVNDKLKAFEITIQYSDILNAQFR